MIDAVLATVAAAGSFYSLWTAFLIRRWIGPGFHSDSIPPPATFFRPVKAGTPDLIRKLQQLADSTLPGDQILIGMDETNEPLPVFPKLADCDLNFIQCKPGFAPNPKISKLIQMFPHARHDRWILSDSEAMLSRDFVTSFRREWSNSDASVLTAPYRFKGGISFPERLDHAATLLTLWPGLAVARLGKIRFTLGACTGFYREDILAAGGWEMFSNDLAEDNRIGKRISSSGKKIRLSSHILTLDSDRMSWLNYFAHQHRVAVTYRTSNPAGYAGMVLTHSLPFAAVLLFLEPQQPWRWMFFGGVSLIRIVAAVSNARQLGFQIKPLPLLVFAHSFLETFFWNFRLPATDQFPEAGAAHWQRVWCQACFPQSG
jgi:ceramide glucosyltransferase